MNRPQHGHEKTSGATETEEDDREQLEADNTNQTERGREKTNEAMETEEDELEQLKQTCMRVL